MPEYLTTNQAVEDYAKLAFEVGNNTKTFKEKWKENLANKGVGVKLDANGVIIKQDINEEDILPLKIIGSIEDAIAEDKVFSKFHPTYNIDPGEIVFSATLNATGAQGHKRGATKNIQQETLIHRDVFPKAIYKLQKLDHMTYLKGSALVKWVLTELPKYVLARLSQAILIGGVVNEDGSAFTAVKAIKGDTELLATGQDLAKDYTGAQLKEQLINDLAEVDTDNPTVFINPKAWAKLALDGDAWAVAMFTGNLDLGGELVKTKILGSDVAYIIVDTNYYLVGFLGSGIETLSAFEIMTNSEVVESRAYVAGTLTKPNVALVCSVATE